MDLNEIITLLGNGAFPIVACAFMFWHTQKLTEIITDLKVTLATMAKKLEDIEDSLEDR